MKISIDIDCTPEEGRAFFGLPDMKPIQDIMVSEMEERIKTYFSSIDAEKLMKMWTPAGMQGMEEMQKAFWSQMTDGNNKKGTK